MPPGGFSTRQEASPPPGEAKPDWQILQEMANGLGANWQYTSTEDIWEEIREAASVFSGISHARLKASSGLFWPCYHESHPGTPRLYEDGFGFRDRRARFLPVELPLNIESSIQRGYLFAPIHDSDPNLNALMSAVPIDPKARMPALKVVPVKVEKHNLVLDLSGHR